MAIKTVVLKGGASSGLKVAACVLDVQKKRKAILDASSPSRRIARK
jgi:hypothetical protein